MEQFKAICTAGLSVQWEPHNRIVQLCVDRGLVDILCDCEGDELQARYDWCVQLGRWVGSRMSVEAINLYWAAAALADHSHPEELRTQRREEVGARILRLLDHALPGDLCEDHLDKVAVLAFAAGVKAERLIETTALRPRVDTLAKAFVDPAIECTRVTLLLSALAQQRTCVDEKRVP
ncbi:hypothetical protein [Ramlibacter albus]|uniref:Uncharacterized protein n=1 Tax=Ramlibacter albus TaxID=2079448 RepID=A0A923M4R5_9BURK|nr:hypothetical protein [Ramlibacter albus]MBC5764172.1 hypothetical protein [Ramlibacter albus]